MHPKWRAWLSSTRALLSNNPRLFWLRAATITAVIWLFTTKRSFWTPDTLFIIFLGLFVVMGQARAFIVRFAPLLGLLLAYDAFRGIADDLNKYVHFTEMIQADKALFGVLPTQTLQQWLWHGSVQWYDFYFYFLYIIHFLVPVILALTIWKLKDSLYWKYVCALVGLSFAGFITYIAFPAAPPWMASDLHYIPTIQHISGNIWQAMGITGFPQIYAQFSPNLVAAVPSLHSAYPVLTVLFLGKLFGWRRVWWAWLYPLSMWVGVVYLGEHYVVDALLGGLYAVVAYAITMRIFAWRAARPSQFKQHWARGYQWGLSYVLDRRAVIIRNE